MSIRLNILNAYLRRFEKRYLAREPDPIPARTRFEAQARLFRAPRGLKKSRITLTHADQNVSAMHVDCGTGPDAPVLLYVHGGAFVMGSARTHMALAARIAQPLGMQVILPNYRLAPEHRFPAAPDDILIAYQALIARGTAPENIVLAGDSAGGGLVLALLHQIGQTGLPMPACSVGFSAIADFTFSGDSFVSNEISEVILPKNRVVDICDMYLGAADPHDPLASPLYGKFSTASPVLLQASTSEMLRDDTTRMAHVLQHQGCHVETRLWNDTPHAWQIFQGYLPEADEAIAHASAFISRQFRS